MGAPNNNSVSFSAKKLGQPVKRRSSGQGVENHGQHRHSWRKCHLGIDELIDGFYQSDLAGKMLDNGHMLNIGNCHLVGVDLFHLPSLILI